MRRNDTGRGGKKIFLNWPADTVNWVSLVGGGGWDLQLRGVFWSTPFINKHTDCSKINTDHSCQCGADG